MVLGLFTTEDIGKEVVIGMYKGVYRPETDDDGKHSTGVEPSTIPQYNMELPTHPVEPFPNTYIDSNVFGNELGCINDATVHTHIRTHTTTHTPNQEMLS